MKKNKNGLVFFAVVVLILAAAIGIYGYFLPDSIAIKQGETTRLNFFLPLTADINGGDLQAISANSRPVEDNIHLVLSDTEICGEEEGSLNMGLSLFGVHIKNVDVNVFSGEEYVPVGETVGIVIDSDGVLVLGTGEVRAKNGEYYEPCKGLLKSGDIIKRVNGIDVMTKEQLAAAIKKDPTRTRIKTDRLAKEIEVIPIISENDIPMIGLWVRDSTQGIGTVTYFSKKNLSFGALGHPVTDVDTGGLIKIRGGDLYRADIQNIVKGEKGMAGELSGVSEDRSGVIGTISKNCSAGIYGKLNNEGKELMDGKSMPIALKNQVKCGKAKILADIDGNGTKEYDIEIEGINIFGKNTGKGMVIRVTDKELIKKTGGIVQGMSGSPIIQNGCLVGAVTHVFIQNPTRGYGIFIENMLAN